ncbi:hemolysin family protein [Phormidium sp. CCY1219]|uniref:hemolysin family protein n=1 Tax=Phormidium sp. CCY1219 TaxID=2886104 RepID=UPI002D1E92E3|nr:hemolysin family protein [Phormidium sp. CCY1219]MEB3827803.1 hemolysin family protein [Phormidium sp. CCY1219]
MEAGSALVTQVPVETAHTWQDLLLRLFSVFALIAINAFFVTTEFAMVSVRRSRINQLAESGDLQAKTVQHLQRNIDRLLSTTQLGITLSSLALGWIGENTMAVLVASWMRQWPLEQNIKQLIAHSLAIPVAFLLVAYLQIVLGELCPKSIALLYAEQLARWLGPLSLAIARFFNPFIWILNQSTRWLLRLGGIRYNPRAWSSRVTPEELQLIIATERESTGLEAEERELLNNVFEFGDVSANEVMVPRTSIRAIPYDATFQTLVDEVVSSTHSRYPVIGESLDDIRGIIYFKQLAEPLARGILTPDTPIAAWIRPARFVPEYTPLSELLPIMQRSERAMVMVVDEFGGTAGLITINDLVAQIIGDSPEIENREALSVQMLDDRTFLVQAQIHLEEVNEILNLDFPLIDDYQTLGGFVLYQFQKIPVEGEVLHYDNLELTVVSAEGPRLNQIRIHRREPASFSPEDLEPLDSFETQEGEPPSSESPLGLDEDERLSPHGQSDADRERSPREEPELGFDDRASPSSREEPDQGFDEDGRSE